jgi:hypothetical protein
VVDQVHHGLEGIPLQIPSELGQPPPERPVGPFWLDLDCALGGLGSLGSLGSSRPLRNRGPLNLVESQTPRPFRGRSSRRGPVSGMVDKGFRGVYTVAHLPWKAPDCRLPSQQTPRTPSQDPPRYAGCSNPGDGPAWKESAPLVLSRALQLAPRRSQGPPRLAHWPKTQQLPPLTAQRGEVLDSSSCQETRHLSS